MQGLLQNIWRITTMKSLVLSIHTELKSFMELIYYAVVSTDSKLIRMSGTNSAKEIRTMR